MILFKLFNKLFHWIYPIYKLLYFFYKSYSDRSRIKYITETIQSGDTVLDIGANIGYYTRLFSKTVGKNGRVIAFEPDKLNFHRLKENTKGLKNVEIHNKAVGDKTGTIKLYYSDDLNVDHQTYDIGEGRRTVEILSVKLDEFFPEAMPIHFIKIDIQGFDFRAMLGMDRILTDDRIRSILGEFWPFGIKKAGDNPIEYIEYLKGKNFKVNLLDQLSEEQIQEKISVKEYYTDYIAVKNNLPASN